MCLKEEAQNYDSQVNRVILLDVQKAPEIGWQKG
jgi:hypothetical protein